MGQTRVAATTAAQSPAAELSPETSE